MSTLIKRLDVLCGKAWQELSPSAQEVVESYACAPYYVCEQYDVSREDPEIETYDCTGRLYVLRLVDGAYVVDYYVLDDEFYMKKKSSSVFKLSASFVERLLALLH
jgi:hypothetical protein